MRRVACCWRARRWRELGVARSRLNQARLSACAFLLCRVACCWRARRWRELGAARSRLNRARLSACAFLLCRIACCWRARRRVGGSPAKAPDFAKEEDQAEVAQRDSGLAEAAFWSAPERVSAFAFAGARRGRIQYGNLRQRIKSFRKIRNLSKTWPLGQKF